MDYDKKMIKKLRIDIFNTIVNNRLSRPYLNVLANIDGIIRNFVP